MIFDFEGMTEDLMKANPELSIDDAREAVAEIGDTPDVDEAGRAIVNLADGRVLLLNLPKEDEA